MIDAFTSAISFYASSICDFLLEEPIIYFTCGFLGIVAIKAMYSLININN